MVAVVNDAEMKLLQFFCQHPTTIFSISAIARETGLSKPWVAEKVGRFAAEELVTVDQQGNMKQIQFNRDSDDAVRLKQIVNLEAVRASGIVDTIVDEFSYPEAVVLFGSFAKGEDVEQSDVDIAVISAEEGGVEADILGRNVSVTVFEPFKVPATMQETLANGIVLYGYLEVG